MIEFSEVAVRRDGRLLFSGATFQIHPGQKVGLTGNNGTGKSTLFAVLLAQKGMGDSDMSVDSGTINMPSGWHIAHMAQEVEGSQQSAINYVLSGDSEWFEINGQLEDSDSLSMEKITDLYQQFDDIDGYRIPTKAAQIMAGLGFATHQHDLPVNDFSGGWRMRLNLAKTLMSRADLLLLDEPTNHLDLDAIIWLEEWISKFSGTVLLISHDQTFLDATIDNILHVENGTITLYSGNYSQFIRTRSERLAQQQQAFEKQEKTKAHLEDFIRRFRAKASKAKQAQSRIRQLERMADISAVMADNPFSFSFYEPSQMSSPLVDIKQADIGYGDTPIITHVTLQITPDTRIGLLGMNGAGKSTLIKAVVGDLPLLSGTYKVSDTLKIGYFNQHQMDSLDSEATPLLMMRRLADKTSDAVLRSFLGSFDFRGDRIDTPSKLFSGGERARLTLALIVWQRPNVLVLDEPTNHLDLQMRQALTMALQGFAGAVVLVSHDRELIANVCDELYLVHDGKMSEFKGDVSDYGKWLSEQRKSASQKSADGNKDKKNNKDNKKGKSDSKKSTNAPASIAKTAANTAASVPASQSTSQSTSQSASQSASQPKTQAKRNPATVGLTKDELRKLNAQFRKQTAPLRKQIDKAETKLDTVTKQLAALETTLADTGLYEDARKDELMGILSEQTTLQQQQAKLEECLLNDMSELEHLEAQFESSLI